MNNQYNNTPYGLSANEVDGGGWHGMFKYPESKGWLCTRYDNNQIIVCGSMEEAIAHAGAQLVWQLNHLASDNQNAKV